MPLAFAAADKGLLPDRMILALIGSGGIIPGAPITPDQTQPASLDLRLGEVAYRVRASFLPGPRATVANRIDDLKLHAIALRGGAVLETGCVYIVPLIESLALPADIAAATNPKSSTGRLTRRHSADCVRAKQKPGRTKSKAGRARPRPFSNIVLRGGKPAGSNDHGITRLLAALSLPVKARVG